MEYAVAKKIPFTSIASISTFHMVRGSARRVLHTSAAKFDPILEPRLEDHGLAIHDKYSLIRDKYGMYYCSHFNLDPNS